MVLRDPPLKKIQVSLPPREETLPVLPRVGLPLALRLVLSMAPGGPVLI
jgi:hypothetical protein